MDFTKVLHEITQKMLEIFQGVYKEMPEDTFENFKTFFLFSLRDT